MLLFAAVLFATVAVGVGQAMADEDSESEGRSHPILEEIESAPWQPLPSQATDLLAARELPHDELDRGEAEELLTSVFPGEVEVSEGALEESEVERYLSDTEAVVRTDGGLGSPYTLAAGSQFAIVAKGGTVSAWVGSGGTFTELLSAKSSTYASGYSGLEAAGNISRISNFRTGALS